MHESLKIMSLKISYYTGLVETVLVLAEPVFLKVKVKFNFTKASTKVLV